MKTIYLLESGTWKGFEYEKISDIQNLLDKRKIKIGSYCEIGSGCKIGSCCEIGSCCKIGSGCKIGSCCEIGSYCKIGSYCEIGSGCKIGSDCKIGSGCEIGSCCKIGSGCKIGSDCKFKKSPIYIIGSKYIVNYYGNKKIRIGCEIQTFETWEKNLQELGKKHNESQDVIDECREYINFIIKNHKICEL
jgi:UDP-3-O-[3-hydroxymyristoyl] glucosamine N-acyltransferase